MTNLQDDLVGENDVLSNRDKAQHSGDRGQDSKWVQTEQLAITRITRDAAKSNAKPHLRC
jgi:hypothetical protein